MMKIRYDNYVIDGISALLVKNDIGLSWLIRSGTICDKNEIG